MTPALIEAAVTAAIQLISFLQQAKANGQLTDEQLDALIAQENDGTRQMIKAALGG